MQTCTPKHEDCYTRESSINLLLTSIAYEELGLANLITSEAEKSNTPYKH